MRSKLDTCRFCNGDDLAIRQGADSGQQSDCFFVFCHGCLAQGPFKWGEAEAIAAWNRRADQLSGNPGELEALKTRVAELEGALARNLARALHEGQTDKAGKPYYWHLHRVAAILVQRWPDASVAEIQAAWLHDALEDTSATAEQLLHSGVSLEAIEIIRRLTRPEGTLYRDWINSIAASGQRGAIRVKLADNADNSNPERLLSAGLSESPLVARYAEAKVVLEAALAKGGRNA